MLGGQGALGATAVVGAGLLVASVLIVVPVRRFGAGPRHHGSSTAFAIGFLGAAVAVLRTTASRRG